MKYGAIVADAIAVFFTQERKKKEIILINFPSFSIWMKIHQVREKFSASYFHFL